MEATIGSYNITPSEYCDNLVTNSTFYFKTPVSVTRTQYIEIIRRLGTSETRDDHAWVAPSSPFGDLVQFQRVLSQRCARIGYVSNIGQFAVIDDDIVRTRSAKFENDTGIPLVNIPEKGMGAPQHVCIAMPSGFFLGGDYSQRGQGCFEAVKVILLDIAGPAVT